MRNPTVIPALLALFLVCTATSALGQYTGGWPRGSVPAGRSSPAFQPAPRIYQPAPRIYQPAPHIFPQAPVRSAEVAPVIPPVLQTPLPASGKWSGHRGGHDQGRHSHRRYGSATAQIPYIYSYSTYYVPPNLVGYPYGLGSGLFGSPLPGYGAYGLGPYGLAPYGAYGPFGSSSFLESDNYDDFFAQPAASTEPDSPRPGPWLEQNIYAAAPPFEARAPYSRPEGNLVEREMARSQQEEEAVPDTYEPEHGSKEATPAVFAPVHPQPATTLIFKDGRPAEKVYNYIMTSKALYSLEEDRRREIPITALDLPATIEANRAAGIDFALPDSEN